jgi:hypothetical protein
VFELGSDNTATRSHPRQIARAPATGFCRNAPRRDGVEDQGLETGGSEQVVASVLPPLHRAPVCRWLRSRFCPQGFGSFGAAIFALTAGLRYIPGMRLRSMILLAAALSSMLFIQVGGLHQHVSLDDGAGGLHGSHLHHVDHGDHDHESEVDVEIFDLGVAYSKTMLFLVALFLTILVCSRAVRATIFPRTNRLFQFRHAHWRPPLRAPPIPA